MPDLDQISETECYQGEVYARTAQGITFHLPSLRRFIPYSWLLCSEMNQNETELHLYYTHATVTITGTNLHFLHDAVEHFRLKAVREMPTTANAQDTTVTRIELTEKTDD
ncbi:MAG: hypothetical protein LV481_14820 [Methylacidiphilales bacterium]|nr:hypothetical protein [Candidatus Methylacidiphilales bacterium]